MKFENKYLKECVEIWNEAVDCGEVVFKPLTEADFENLFLSEKYKSVGVVKVENRKACGFAFGTVSEGVGYVSYIGVKRGFREEGIGRELYLELETTILKENPLVNRIDCIFYNPCQIAWFIPKRFPHDHPGAPGVYMESIGYQFFKKMGFFDYAIQNTYYMPLGNYSESEKVKEKKESLSEQGIEVCFFDKEKHCGFSELFDNIKNEGWRKSVMSRLNEKIVVAVEDNRVIGYTGPLSLSSEKRGLFCGIGVHTDYRRLGIGKVLFSELCAGLQTMGAEYMSLFTGDNNPARFIYESTGFELVGKFSCMRKML